MKNAITFLILFSLLTFSSCTTEESASVDQAKIFTYYELLYDASADKTTAYAQFKFGNAIGTQLKLSNDSRVTFNNDALVFEPLTSLYIKEYPGNISSGTFKWIDTNGKEFVNAIQIKSPISLPAIPKISKSASFELVWVGKALEENEVVGLLMTGPTGQTPQNVIQSALNSTSITVAKNQLESIATGAVAISVDRSYEFPSLNAPSSGGRLLSKYRVGKLNIPLEN